MAYAANTSVPVERSRAQLEVLLKRAGAVGFVSGWQENVVMIGFEYGDPHRHVKFVLHMPAADDAEIRFNGRGTVRTDLQIEKEMEKEEKRRWRALLLVVKAKLEAVETGIATFEEEFLAYTVLPGGKTVGEIVRPKLNKVYQTGNVGRLLGMDD